MVGFLVPLDSTRIIDKSLCIFKRRFPEDNIIIFWKGVMFVVSYEPLWKTMKERNITTYTLIYKLGKL